jgi:hypothetical protein
MAVLRRGGMLPQAYVYPATRRAPRDLLRRRMDLTRKRAELLAPIQNTNRQYTLPERGKKRAYHANRDGVAERCPDPAGQQSMAGARARLGYSAPLLHALEWHLVKAATQPDAPTLYLLHTVPGIGKSLRLVLRYELHDSQRFPSVQDFVA